MLKNTSSDYSNCSLASLETVNCSDDTGLDYRNNRLNPDLVITYNLHIKGTAGVTFVLLLSFSVHYPSITEYTFGRPATDGKLLYETHVIRHIPTLAQCIRIINTIFI